VEMGGIEIAHINPINKAFNISNLKLCTQIMNQKKQLLEVIESIINF
tara:strand:+ start:85 stop:225 length:141 start_codon:yes stop_codon:yes gene_type:complete